MFMDLINKPGNKPFSLVPRMLQSMVYSYLLGAGVLSNFVQVYSSAGDSVAELELVMKLVFCIERDLVIDVETFIKKSRGLCTFQVLFTVSTHYCGVAVQASGHCSQAMLCNLKPAFGAAFLPRIMLFNSHVCSCVYIACQIAISVYCLLYLLL